MGNARKPKEGKLLYHITHINNMESILTRGLLPRKKLDEEEMKYEDIADKEIMKKREVIDLNKYVLFHFFVKNPFDYSVSNTYGSDKLVIISIKREVAKQLNFKIIPSHPLHCYEVYSYDEGFEKIDWNVINDVENRDYDNNKIKNACMAECVCEGKVDVNNFFKVYVPNFDGLKCINKICKDNDIELNIEINSNMFVKKYKI